MNWRRRRFISFASKSLVALAIGLTAAPLARACEGRALDKVKSSQIETLQKSIAASAATLKPHLDAPDPKIAAKAQEDLPSFRKVHWLDPDQTGKRTPLADVYFGSEYASNFETFVLPRDDRVLCLIAPGQGVLLSDDVTHHYAMIYSVDVKRKRVTLLDNWASVSFLLPGRNVSGVEAVASVGKNGENLLELTFDDFVRSLRGILCVAFVQNFFTAIEKNYADQAGTEDYSFWKYSRMLTSGDFEVALMIALELGGGDQKKEKLKLLKAFSNDVAIGLMSNFSVAGLGAPQADSGKNKAAFLLRLDAYAKELPWTLRWFLLDKADMTQDPSVRMAIVDAFLKADKTDVDFQIKRAQFLLREGRLGDARAQLDQAEKQWKTNVAAVIDAPSEGEALKIFQEKDYGLQSHEILRWQAARIRYLRAAVELSEPNPGKDAKITRLSSADEILREAFPPYTKEAELAGDNRARSDFRVETLQTLFLADKKPEEERSLLSFVEAAEHLAAHPKKIAGGARPVTAERAAASAENSRVAVYRHLVESRSVNDLSADTRSRLAASRIWPEICQMAKGRTRFSAYNAPALENQLIAFCK